MKSINSREYIGKLVTVTIDRPLGARHPRHDIIYSINYGYILDTKADDGAELDAYIVGVDQPLSTFTGRCIAVIERTNDSDDKLVIVPDGVSIDDATIREKTHFQEQYFESIILRS